MDHAKVESEGNLDPNQSCCVHHLALDIGGNLKPSSWLTFYLLVFIVRAHFAIMRYEIEAVLWFLSFLVYCFGSLLTNIIIMLKFVICLCFFTEPCSYSELFITWWGRLFWVCGRLKFCFTIHITIVLIKLVKWYNFCWSNSLILE